MAPLVSCSDDKEPAFVHLLITNIEVPLALWKRANRFRAAEQFR